MTGYEDALYFEYLLNVLIGWNSYAISSVKFQQTNKLETHLIPFLCWCFLFFLGQRANDAQTIHLTKPLNRLHLLQHQK